jgi:vacuolar protein sorting-associated protein 26
VEIDVLLTNENDRKTALVKQKDKTERLPLYFDGESVSGKAILRIKQGRKLEHTGIKIEFIGQIGMRIIAHVRIIL